MKVVVSLIFAFFLLGCSRTVPPKVEYRLSPSVESKESSLSSCKEQSIKVLHAFSPRYLTTSDMSYTLGQNEQYSYSQSKWVTSPNSTVSNELIKALQDADIFKQVQTFKSIGKSTLVLETEIEDFMQYYSLDEKSSFVHVAINLSVIDAKTNEVLSAQKIQSRVEVSELNAKGGVMALQKALEEVLGQSVQFLQKSCK